MQTSSYHIRRYDHWLILMTVACVTFFVLLFEPLQSTERQEKRISGLQYLADADNRYDLDTFNPDGPHPWQDILNPANLGMHAIPFWFHFQLDASSTFSDETILEIGYPLLDNVQVAIYRSGDSTPLVVYRGGDNELFSQRVIKHVALLFPIPVSDVPLTIVVRVETSGPLKVPFRQWTAMEFIEEDAGNKLQMGVFFGFLIAMGCSNLFLFITTRNKTFFMHAAHVFSLVLALGSLSGVGYAYLWPDQLWLVDRAVLIFTCFTFYFAMLFTRSLLDLEKFSPAWDKALKFVGLFFAAGVVMAAIFPYYFLIKLYLIGLIFAVLLSTAAAICMAIKGYIVARYYAYTWTILLLSCVAASLDNLNVISLPVSPNYLLMLSAMVETLLLAAIVAISYRMNREEMNNVKDEVLKQEQLALSARGDLLAIQEQYQNELEYKVQERTLELEITLRELSEANSELENLNSVDALTGIRNRRHFDKRLQAESRRSRREQTLLSVAMIDIDHFKKINDTFGHASGDACLRHVANLLLLTLRRSSDDVCRYGGEEFGVILPNTELDGAIQVIEAMCEKIASMPIEVDENVIQLTISAGVSSAIMNAEEHEITLLKEADSALYQAKQQGRNRVIGFTEKGAKE